MTPQPPRRRAAPHVARTGRSARTATTAVLAVVLAMGATPAAAEFSNGEATQFGAITLPAYMPGRGPVPIEARIHLEHPDDLPPDGHLLVGFSTPDPAAHVRIDALTRLDGTPLTPEESPAPGVDDEPRLAVAASELQGLSDFVLHGTAWSDQNGRFHIGALVMAFTNDWGPVVTGDGVPAQAYAFTWLGARQLTGAGGPFWGQGNDFVALLPAVVLVGLCGFLWWLSRRPVRPLRVRPARGVFKHEPRRILTAPPIVAAPVAPSPHRNGALLSNMRRQSRRPNPGEHPVRVRMRAAPASDPRAPFRDRVPRPRPMPPPTPPGSDPESDPDPPGPVPDLQARAGGPATQRPPRPVTPRRPAPGPGLRPGAPTRANPGGPGQGAAARPSRPAPWRTGR